jgi:hypothetical protein
VGGQWRASMADEGDTGWSSAGGDLKGRASRGGSNRDGELRQMARGRRPRHGRGRPDAKRACIDGGGVSSQRAMWAVACCGVVSVRVAVRARSERAATDAGLGAEEP